MKTAIITVGLPHSGKAAYAKDLIERDNRWVEINRDNIRKTLFNVTGWSEYEISVEKEALVTTEQYNQIRKAINENKNIIVTNTNLRMKYIRKLFSLFEHHGFSVQIKMFDITLIELIRRNFESSSSNDERAIIESLNHYNWLKHKVVEKYSDFVEIVQ